MKFRKVGNAMSPDGKMSKLQFVKWLLTCGLVPYENFEPEEESKEFRDEGETMLEADNSVADAMTGMLEVSLSDESVDRALPEVSGLPSGHAADENEVFNLIPLKKWKQNQI